MAGTAPPGPSPGVMAGTSSFVGEKDSAESGGIRRRPVPVHFDWHVTPADGDDAEGDDEVVFEEEAPSKFQEYFGIVCDYVFWILLAYCASNLLLWVGEKLGVISPQYEEWNPVRWFHSDPHRLQKELFDNATSSAATVTQFQSLKEWIAGGPGGWVSPKLSVHDYLSERGRYDRRLEVLSSVDEGEVLVKLPLSHVLSADYCQQDLTDNTIRQVVDALKASSEKIEITPWTWIALYMIAHTKRSGTAHVASWRLNSLLRNEYMDASLSYIPLFWDDKNLEWLNGTDLLNVHILDVHAAIESQYHTLVYLVSSVESSVSVVEFKKWAMVVMSRAETLNLPDRENKSRTSPQLAVMPLLDLLDHHLPLPTEPLVTEEDLRHYQENGTQTNIAYDTELAAVVLTAKKALASKAAVTSGYGVRSNADYLLYHGFTMPRKWSDLTLCTQYSMVELPLPEDMEGWKSRFLTQPFRFAVPACPNQKSTPHVIVAGARFMLVSEDDVLAFEDKVSKNPKLLEVAAQMKEEKFLHHAANEAVQVVCDTKVQPPLCRSPMSVASERAAWALIVKQTIARVVHHTTTIEEDERILDKDDAEFAAGSNGSAHTATGGLSVNERHAVIARREEKLALRRWCAVAVRTATFLDSPEGEAEMETFWVPESEVLEHEEPRVRPRYWARLLDPVEEGSVPKECNEFR